MLWTIGILEAFHLRESLMKFREEEKQIENDVKIMREDLAQMQHYRDEITSSSAEITRLRQKSTIFQVTMKDRIKYHEENKQRAEADFNTILQRYAKDSSDANKVVGIQAVEREVRKKEETLTAIREKRTDYEARLKGR
jgi:lipopolysaccharide export LptBFGC system permease protein LptF